MGIYDVSVRCRDKSWRYMMSLCGVGINRGDTYHCWASRGKVFVLRRHLILYITYLS